ncbi:EamA family transporter RarD [Actinomyces sp. B33]|uniref:EamA family transporter RarD n=1 Tax=Actinomyces sp. B33 TaxID=2942131 RepID=UPI002341DFE6|nr:EamA family transporter RarD [Actinomyces sp. B33]MDC4232581.1 EamA family transporter RarD [Actinomyces sp. B33]
MSTHTPARPASPAASLALGIGAYLIWGFFPLYFHRLSPAGPLEAISHRAIWGLVFCLIGLAVTGRLPLLRAALADRPALARLSVAGILIIVNWTTYVLAIQTGRTVDAAIGYFINPLITIALSLIVLRETISRLQGIALGLGALAVVILVIGQRSLPWVSLTLALSFGLYSLVKKDLAGRVDPLVGMTIETAAVSPLLLAHIGFLVATGSTSLHVLVRSRTAGEAVIHPAAHLALLVGAGLLTIIPLIMFASSARGLPLVTLGFIQYLAPVLQLTIGVAVFHEPVEPARWAAFGVVWCALALLMVDGAVTARRQRRILRG